MGFTPTVIEGAADLGRLIRARRREAGLTLTDAAALLGIGRRLLIELEHGQRHASIATVLRVLHGLGVRLVAEGRGYAGAAAPPSAAPPRPRTRGGRIRRVPRRTAAE